MIRASFVNSGPDVTLTGRLCGKVQTQSGRFKPRFTGLMTEVASTINSVGSYLFPRTDIPEPFFPQLDCALGISPTRAAKAYASITDVRTAAATRGPTPVILINRISVLP